MQYCRNVRTFDQCEPDGLREEIDLQILRVSSLSAAVAQVVELTCMGHDKANSILEIS